MRKITLSRGPEVDVNNCVELTGGNRFNLVLIASARARELKRQNRENPNATFGQIHTNVTALKEIEAGEIDAHKYLMKVR
jgi:DNA-directed RNA polymerase omega subunit